MTTYKLMVTWSKRPSANKTVLGHDDFFTEKILPKTFPTLKDARAYAVRLMDDDRKIHDIQISNPHYMDVWQVYTGVKRANGRYYWYAIRPRQTVGHGHYINKDGTISKQTVN